MYVPALEKKLKLYIALETKLMSADFLYLFNKQPKRLNLTLKFQKNNTCRSALYTKEPI